MSLGKQAKTLSKGQIDAALGYIDRTRHPIRNRAILLLSVKAGLRAKEMACLTWEMVTDAAGTIGRDIHLQDVAAMLRAKGFKVRRLEDGLPEWRAAGLPVVTEGK